MPKVTEVSIHVDAQPAALFKAWTDQRELEAWFAEHASVDLENGVFDFWGKHSPGAPAPGNAKLLGFERDRELRFGWRVIGRDTLVRVTFEAEGGGALVTVRHEGVGPASHDEPLNFADSWCLALQNLRAWVEDGTPAWRVDYTAVPVGEVRFAIECAAPAERIFTALIDPAQLDRWMAESADVEPVVGGRYDMGWGDEGGRPLKILDLEPGKKLSYSWADPDVDGTIVTWELEGSGGATRITLVHSGFGDQQPTGYFAGWADFFLRLQVMCEKGDAWQGPKWRAAEAS